MNENQVTRQYFYFEKFMIEENVFIYVNAAIMLVSACLYLIPSFIQLAATIREFYNLKEENRFTIYAVPKTKQQIQRSNTVITETKTQTWIVILLFISG